MSFIHASLLAGLAAIAVPIIIHFLNRRRFRIVRWAAMDFLLAAQRKNRRRIRLEHLIVLILRCLAVAAIVLAVARPVFTSGALLDIPGLQEPIERVVILDDSGSMAYAAGRSTSFERAKQVLADLFEDLNKTRSGDYLTVFRTSQAEPDLMLSNLEGARDFMDALENLHPSEQSFDVPRSLGRILKLVNAAGGPQQKVVYVLSDVLHHDWVGEQGLTPRAIGDVTREVPEDVRFLVVDTGASATTNLSLVRLELAEKLAVVDVPVDLVIEVANRGPEAVYDVRLALDTGVTQVPLPAIPVIDAEGTEELRYRYTFTEPGVHALSVRLPNDNLALDDKRHLALRVEETLSVLLVNGEDTPGPLGAETDLLRLALAPSSDAFTGVEPQVLRASEATRVDLSTFQSVILCNVDAWPIDQLAALEGYVARGGGLGIFLGDRISEEAYVGVRGYGVGGATPPIAQLSNLYREGKGLLPTALGRRVEVERSEAAARQRPGARPPVNMQPPLARHDLTNVFLGDRNPFLRNVRAWTWRELPLDPKRDPSSRVILRLDDGEPGTPFVVEKPYGRGRVVLFNTTADLAWSNWPKDPSWTVTSQELIKLLAPGSTQGLNGAIDGPIERPVNPAQFEPFVRILTPTGDGAREVHAQPREGADVLWFTFPETREQGLYQLEYLPRGAGAPQVGYHAVNVDPQEGDLEPADPERIQSGLEDARIEFAALDDEETRLLTLSDGSRAEGWRAALFLLIAFMLLEQWRAWRAAHHSDDAYPDPTPARATEETA